MQLKKIMHSKTNAQRPSKVTSGVSIVRVVRLTAGVFAMVMLAYLFAPQSIARGPIIQIMVGLSIALYTCVWLQFFSLVSPYEKQPPMQKDNVEK